MIQIDPQRMLAIADALREQIPNVSPQASRPMIDAAGELQRLADQFERMRKAQAEAASKLVESLIADLTTNCDCAFCRAQRATEGKPSAGELN